jgi:hypothetical protein
MQMTRSDHVKILFRIERDEDGYPPEDAESVWAVPVEGGYQIDNVPFFVRDIALGDIVSAEPAHDGMLEFTGEVIRRSGHSTYRVLLREQREGDPDTSIEELKSLGLGVEMDLDCLLAVDVPPHVPLDKIRTYFFHKIDTGEWEVQEAYRTNAP